MKPTFTQICKIFLFLFPIFLFGQTSPSGQAKFIAPSILSACNTDTICVEVTNLQGAKNTVYSGNVTLEIDIPGDTLIEFIAGSVSSVPAGATMVSYSNNKLIISLPLPNVGAITKVCFVVRPNCKVADLAELPNFKGKISYPSGYPTPTETFESGDLNVGSAILSHSPYADPFFNSSPPFNTQFRVISNIANSGYGNMDELYYYTVHHNDFTGVVGYVYAISASNVYTNTAYIYPVSTTPFDATHTLRKYKLADVYLGADNTISPGETIRFDEYMNASNHCEIYTSKVWVDYTCGVGKPVCQIPDTLTATINVAAGTPLIAGTLVSAEDADGCPNKKVIFNYTNNGVGNAAPVGNAYDVNLGISFGGGLMKISGLKLNGMVVPAANITPGASASSFTILLKDLMTTDPDGAGGISDIDGDGFFDDMLVAATTQVEFDYTIPCDEACGANLFYQMTSTATFTDFCRSLVGSTNTPLKEFGFQQVQPIEQTRKVDFGTLTTGEMKTDTAKFKFQYKSYNMDFTNATTDLVIRYSRKMEVNPASIRINNVAPTNTPVVFGTDTPGVPGTDNDSMIVVSLTNAERDALFDATGDSLKYVQTYYGCADRQNTFTGDYWQLVVKVNQGLCSDGSTPCAFDLACKKVFAYQSGNSCGTIPCYINDFTFAREKYAGHTAVDELTTLPIDKKRAYEGDTVLFKNTFFISGDWPQEPNGFYTNQGKPFLDLRQNFSFHYSKPKGWNEKTNPWIFLPSYSTVCVRQRTPDPADPRLPGTYGAVIIEVPLLLADFGSDGGNLPATNQVNYARTRYTYPPNTNGSPAAYCLTSPNSWHIKGLCPNIYDGFDYGYGFANISGYRYHNIEDTKLNDLYYVNIGKALARGGWTSPAGDDNFVFEVKTRWKMDETFPWDNSNDFAFAGYVEHLGNYQSVPTTLPTTTDNSSCNNGAETGLAVTKEHYISNPNAVYNAACGLRASNKVFFHSYEGNYFDNGTGEVRVPLKIDSIVIDLPTEYSITAGTIKIKYHQNCVENTDATSITNSTATGHVVFTNSASTTGGDFPRADDCSGNKTAYDLCYDLVKTGSAAPTLYRYPIKIYTRDEWGHVTILRDSASISEDKPELVLTPIAPTFTIPDGGACQPYFVEYLIQNNTQYDAPNTYFAATSTANTAIVNITDGGNVYPDPIISTDTFPYATNNVFAKLGTIKAGDKRIVRVYGRTSICTDALKVYANFGCAYPVNNQPELSSPTLDSSNYAFSSLKPAMLSRPIADLNVMNLCDNKTVEIEVRNAKLANIYKLMAGFKLPAGSSYVPNTAKIQYTATTGTYLTIATADVTLPTADSLVLDLTNNNPFNTPCALTGSDTTVLAVLRLKFDIEFTACPASSLGQIPYRVMGENFCGVKAFTRGNIRVNYIGSGGNKNNYTLSPSTKALDMCAKKNETQSISDSLFIKNVGGFGPLSGPSSGLDSMMITVPFDLSQFTLTNFMVLSPFSSPVFGTNGLGQMTIRVLIPAGVPIDGTILMPMSYDLTPKRDSICLLFDNPHICFFAQFSAPVLLECPAKSLSCNSISKAPVGTGISLRAFNCCFGSIGDYVWFDRNKDGLQGTTTAEPPVSGLKVYLLNGVGAVIDSTQTDMNGKYLFANLFSGNYQVKFNIPINNKVTLTNNPSDDTKDSDVDAGGLSHLISINGALAASDTLRNNPHIDLGLIPCLDPTIGSIVSVDATCLNGVIQSDAKITVSGITNGTSYTYSTSGTTGLLGSNAIAFSGNTFMISSLPNPATATVYTVRVFGIDTICFADIAITLNPRAACPVCSIDATISQSACNDNGTTSTPADDYFTVTVSAVSATNGGTSGKYEVLYGATVLNPGGTAYGTSVTVGAASTFLADGVSTYSLVIRDLDIAGCEVVKTTTPVASCSTVVCPPKVCLPVQVTKVN
jgi:hypothetical protein